MRFHGYLGLLTLACTSGCLRDPVTVAGSSGGGSHGSEVSGANTSEGSGPGPAMPTTTGAPPRTDDSTSTGPTPRGSSSTSTHGASSDSSSGGFVCNSLCGDGLVNCGEECDCGIKGCTAEGLGFQTCRSLVDILNPDHVFTGGELRCNMASCRYDFGGCEWGCGDGILAQDEACDPGLDTPTCAELDMGTAPDPVPCTEDCELETSVCDPAPPED